MFFLRRQSAALPPWFLHAAFMSISSVKREAFHTILPVVSRKNAVFPHTSCRAGYAAAARFAFFKGKMLYFRGGV